MDISIAGTSISHPENILSGSKLLPDHCSNRTCMQISLWMSMGWWNRRVYMENDVYIKDHNLLTAPRDENVDGSRWMGWSFRFKSRKMLVLGCHSRNASRNSVISLENKWTTRSSAIISRSAQGIYITQLSNHPLELNDIRPAHLVIVLFMTRIERLNVKLTWSIRPVVGQEQILDSKPKKLEKKGNDRILLHSYPI